MKDLSQFKYPIILIFLIGVFFIHLNKDRSEIHELDRQKELLRLEIQQYRLNEVKKEKHIEYLMTKYNQAKDSLTVERKNVKVKYIEYKQPVKVDLSTDVKRDSVIESIIIH